jgi:hydroxyethylthiazole kinase
MDVMANTLLAAGASPAMAHAMDEVEDFVKISSGQHR